jgi:hypothetical protein
MALSDAVGQLAFLAKEAETRSASRSHCDVITANNHAEDLRAARSDVDTGSHP